GVVLGDLDWIVGGDQRGRGGEDDSLGAPGDVGEEGGWRGGEEGWVVMLSDPEHVKTDLLGFAGDLDHGVDPFRLAGCLARDRIPGDITDPEYTELHGKPSLYIPRL